MDKYVKHYRLSGSDTEETLDEPKAAYTLHDSKTDNLIPLVGRSYQSDTDRDFEQSYESGDFTTPDSHHVTLHKARRKNDRGKRENRCDSPSFGTSSSLSSITVKDYSQDFDVSGVYSELQEINRKLKREFKILHDKDLILKEKEKSLNSAHEDFEVRVQEEMKQRIAAREDDWRHLAETCERHLRDKTKENKRLKENFDTLKNANETLRKEMESLQLQHDKLEKQNNSLQARLINLQRKKDHTQRKDDEPLIAEFVKPSKSKTSNAEDTKKSHSKVSKSTLEVLTILAEWVSEVHLKPAIAEGPTRPLEAFFKTDFIMEKCLKVLPSIVELLKEKDNPMQNNQFWLPCLQFVYWSVLHLEANTGQQKVGLSSTLRRLGEQLYSAKPAKIPVPSLLDSEAEVTETRKEGTFFKSPHLHIRFLSSLIILKTITQVDHLAHVMEVLRNDIKEDSAKQLFLHYQATTLMIPFLKPTNKLLLNWAIDLHLQMTTESAMSQAFLESCGTESWFRVVSLVLRMPSIEEKLLEKLSILLQKLSKIKSNRRYFEVFGVTNTIQDLMTSHNKENAFLGLNLRSILFNLNQKA